MLTDIRTASGASVIHTDSHEPHPVDIGLLQPGEEHDWDRFVRDSPFGTFFHLTGWKSVVQNVLGHSYFELVARRANKICGVFPIARVRNPLFGDSLISMPLAVYGGICANDADSYCHLLNAGRDLAHRLGVKYLEMRNCFEPFSTSLPGRDLYVTFTQDLSPGSDKLLQALPRDTRYAIRKSQKAGLEWTEDIAEGQFYEIYAHSVHRLGTPVFPRTLFTEIRHTFPGQVKLFGVKKAGKAIAGVLCLYFNGTVMPYYGGALDGYQKDSPNNFMYWNLIVQSCADGLRHFDFGRSKRGTGSYKFKSAWAMAESPLPYKYHLGRAKQVPHLSPVDSAFQLPIALWKRLPFGCTKLLGPALVRWIPSI